MIQGVNMSNKYDFLIVGAGLYGAVMAQELKKKGYKVLVIEKRNHIGGNVYTENIEGIDVHKYGAHIFHTNDETVWNYINQFADFNHYVNCPIAVYNGKLFNLPFNMNTFYQMWGQSEPNKVKAIIASQRQEVDGQATNLEEQAIQLVGRDIYETLIKGYTEKQWGRSCRELPPFIIKRLPVRFTFDNNYFNDCYQGIPINGYTSIIENMMTDIDLHLKTDYFENRDFYNDMCEHIVYTGPIDQFFDYCYGPLDYRSLRFETEVLDMENYQGNAVFNFTDTSVPYTRIIEHKHFNFGKQKKTVISKEYSEEWTLGKEAYYPVNDDKNQAIYKMYLQKTKNLDHVSFGGRLGDYKYYNMDQIIKLALDASSKL